MININIVEVFIFNFSINDQNIFYEELNSFADLNFQTLINYIYLTEVSNEIYLNRKKIKFQTQFKFIVIKCFLNRFNIS